MKLHLYYTYSTVLTMSSLWVEHLCPLHLLRNRVHLIRVVIGFDPAGSIQGDECGIIVGALYSDNHVT